MSDPVSPGGEAQAPAAAEPPQQQLGPPSTPETAALRDQASACSILVGCNAALRTFKIHSADNAAIERPLESLIGNVKTLVGSRGKVVIAQVEGVFYLGDTRLKLGGAHQGIADQFAVELSSRNLGGFTFLDAPDRDELIRFFTVLNDQAHGEVSAESVRAAIRAAGITAIQVSKPLKAVSEGQEKKSTTEKASEVFSAAVEHAATMYKDLAPQAQGRNMRPGNVRSQRIVQELVDVADGDPAVILSLAGLRGAGDEEAEHSICTAVLAIAMGKRLGLSKQVLADLGLAAVYHDQGLKLLPESEQDDKAKHPVLAIKALLGKTEADPRLLRQVVVSFEHHLNADCKGGHPTLRFKRRIHPMSQIVRLANDFDGLTRGRHTLRALDVDEAVRHMLAGSGTAYHPGLLKLFVELVGGVYEPGHTPVPELQPVSPELQQIRDELQEVRAKTPDDVSKIDSLEAMAAALAAMDLSAPSSAPLAASPATPFAAAQRAAGKKPKGVLGALKLKRIKKKPKA